MAELVKRVCAQPGCPNVGPGKWCERHHRPTDAELGRQSAAARGYDRRWQRLRLMVLGRDPICRACGRAASVDADHIIPKSKGGIDALDNLQGLCHRCHSMKTQEENR